ARVFAEEFFAAGEETVRRLSSLPFLLIFLVPLSPLSPLRMLIAAQSRLTMTASSTLYFLQLVIAQSSNTTNSNFRATLRMIRIMRQVVQRNSIVKDSAN